MTAAEHSPARIALVVVDAQQGFDHPRWGRRNNPRADANIARLFESFVRTERPIVLVQHASRRPGAPLHPDQPGHALKAYLDPSKAHLRVLKSVNSSFHGAPDLEQWLRTNEIDTVMIAGITTNHCCETTARVADNLGFNVLFVLDATHTFDRVGPDGDSMTADELSRATATNLHGEFAEVITTGAAINLIG